MVITLHAQRNPDSLATREAGSTRDRFAYPSMRPVKKPEIWSDPLVLIPAKRHSRQRIPIARQPIEPSQVLGGSPS